MKKSLLAFFTILSCISLYAEQSDPIPSGIEAESRVLPFATRSNNYNTPYNIKTSFSQSIYTKEELGASAKIISAIEYFLLKKPAHSESRKLQVWIKEIEKDSFVINPSDAQFYLIYDEISGTPKQYLPGTKVFDGSVTIPESDSYTITFDDDFEWSGNKNICVTIADVTCASYTYTEVRHAIVSTDRPRFNYRYTNSTSASDWLWVNNNSLDFYGLEGASELRGMKWAETATAVVGSQCANRKYAPKAVFTFKDPSPTPTPPATPDDLNVSATSTNSATLAWSAVDGAISYDLEQSANGSDWSTLVSNVSGMSYNWIGLAASSTQYARICAKNANGSSAWSSSVIVTTDAVFDYKDIIFSKWSTTNAIPTSGDYYLNADVELSGDVSLSGDLNLCLNGHSINTYVYNITVPDGKTLSIYNNEESGSIYGYFVTTALNPFHGLIDVEVGGTLVMGEGVVTNLSSVFNEGEIAYGIFSAGTLKISGAPVISGYHADICLFSNKYITLDGELTNISSAKYSVNSAGQTFTSGWSTYMSGEKPSDHFVSAKSGYEGICVVENEAKLVKLLDLNESSSNTNISDGTYSGTICVSMTRSLTSSQFNTFCLPFALSNAQMEEFFGEGYDLEEFDGASLDGDVLSLTFNKVTALEAGKPYLLQPSINVVNPSFEGVTIAETSPVDQTSDTYISFHGTYAPTELAGGNKNLLFLGADNELFWPESTGNIKGFRAYFEVKGSAAKAAKKARIVKKEDSATGIDQITNDQSPMTNKIIKDNQLLILRGNKTYNVIGQMVK